MGRVANPRVPRRLSERLDADLGTDPVGDDPRRRTTTGELVAEHVRQLVFDGVLRPGDRVPQGDLAAELGVSRLPVREAVIELARDGLVSVTPHTGAFIAPFDAEVMRQHFAIVGLVQGLAAREVAVAADSTVLAALGTAVDRIDAAATAGDAAAAHGATIDFLRTLNLAGGSARQQAVLRALARMLPTGFFADVPGATASEQRAAHRVLDALRTGDPVLAEQACLVSQREHAELVVAHQEARGVFARPGPAPGPDGPLA